ncbi:Isoaspartyl peptidase precursor [Tsuneonella dongtanensis]|uniref:Isoaspartyl peptidase n=1 Tax=Tsuneonella dongtanensis TaxID=692370 RepID=A0A1B2ACB7_9SPHN|nr:isoaspartyl peptidase/L-asparaginase [Tsuneonella dongtanensis]ANY19695.1 Isoaspartyl peptidase precursor [Tsuneonella dongtanensis]
MRKSLLAILGLAMTFTMPALAHDAPSKPDWSFAIHGGAGVLQRDRMTPEKQAEYRTALQAALDAGSKVLREGGTSIDAVTAAITILEDDPKFNAGRGAVFTWEGINELDASIMDGNGRKAGAIAGVHVVRHPILLAKAVMQDGRHVLLSGKGAEEFAMDRDLEIVPPEFFATEERREQLERLKAKNLSALDVEFKYGTVGAVARDSAGHLAAGTSTGGMTGKRWGRIGDSPLIGAGTYADDASCAVSATGSGEYFIRVAVAHSICERVKAARRMTLAGETQDVPLTTEVLQGIVDGVIAEVGELGGDGGVIVVSPSGEPVFSMNTPGMYRGRATANGLNEVAIFADE